LLHRCAVVQSDQIAVQLVNPAIHQNHGQFAVQIAQFIQMMPEGIHDQTLDVVRPQRRQMQAFLFVIAIGVTHHKAITVTSAGSFDTVHDSNGIGVANIGDEHADQSRSTALQAAGHLIGTITEGFDGLLDAQGDGIGE